MRHHKMTFGTIGIVALAAWATGTLDPMARRDVLSAQESRQDPLPKPVVNTHELMELFNEPLYKELQTALSQDSLDEKQWKSVEESGYKLAEVANLIAIREEAAEHPRWESMAVDIQQLGYELAKIAGKQELPAAREQFNAIVQNCNDCHMRTARDHAPELEPIDVE
jgi:hypothetical protein